MANPSSVPQHDEADPVAILALEDLNVRATTRIELENRNTAPVLPVSDVGEVSSEPPIAYVGSPERSNPVSYLRALSPERAPALTSLPVTLQHP